MTQRIPQERAADPDQIAKFVFKLSHGDNDRALMPNKSNVAPTINHVGMQYPVMSALNVQNSKCPWIYIIFSSDVCE